MPDEARFAEMPALIAFAAYLVLVLGIGCVTARRSSTGLGEYFLGGRTARTVVVFMALLGTNVTPFVIMGIPGLSYHHGVGVFGLNAAIVALGIVGISYIWFRVPTKETVLAQRATSGP